MKLILFLFAILNLNLGFAQVDKIFWFVAPEANQSHGDRPIFFRFASLSESTTITVSQPANSDFVNIQFTLEPNSAYELDVTTWIDTIENKPADEVLNFGIKIEGTNDFMAYYEINPICRCNPDIFALKGKNALGTSFITPFQTFFENSGNYASGINIVATENNTDITILPSQEVVGHAAGVPFDITLDKGETYLVEASRTSDNQHLTGSTVSSDKPIAITIHDDSLSGQPYGGCMDIAGDQLIPINLIGQEYIAIKGYLNGEDKIYVVAQNDATEISVDGLVVSTINALETYEITLSNPSAYIYTSNPSYVLHVTGFGCELGEAVLPPIECTGSTDVSFVRSTNEFFALNILIPTGAEGGFTIDGDSSIIQASDFSAVPGSNNNWQFAQINLTNSITQGAAKRVYNSMDRFHLGLIHGGGGSGCRYGYFSDFAKFDASFTASNDVCEGDSILFTAPFYDNASYTWTGPNGFSSTEQNPVIEVGTIEYQGAYNLDITIDEDCVSSSTSSVEILERPAEFELSSISICDYTTLNDLVIEFPSSVWFDSEDSVTPLSITTLLVAGQVYYAVYTNANQCYSSTKVSVTLGCFPIIPNAFSPNGDGYNDFFNITSLYDVYLNHELKIYNRYGKLVFNGDNTTKWDGSSNVQPQSSNTVPVGTYFYYLALNNDAKDIISGYVYVNY